MKMSEFVKAIAASNERAFANVSEQQAQRIAAAILRDIAARLEALEEGKLTVPGLGNFRVKEGKNKQGELVKRIIFRPAQPGRAKKQADNEE